jgi:hypothetical protein
MAFENCQLPYDFRGEVADVDALREVDASTLAPTTVYLVRDEDLCVIYQPGWNGPEDPANGVIRPNGVDPASPGRWVFLQFLPVCERRLVLARNIFCAPVVWSAAGSVIASGSGKISPRIGPCEVGGTLTVSGVFQVVGSASCTVLTNGAPTNQLPVQGPAGVTVTNTFTDLSVKEPGDYEFALVGRSDSGVFVGWAQLLLEVYTLPMTR